MRKKSLSLLLAVAMLLLCVPTGAVPRMSAETSADGFTYWIIDGKATVAGYTGSATELVIPDTLGGYPVTEICESAFYNYDGLYDGLTSITIPDSVTSIGDYAFRGCRGLTSLTIPDSVTRIGEYAFASCSGLTSLTLPDSNPQVGDAVFSGCTGLTSLTIPKHWTIGYMMFCYCTGLTSLTISKASGINDYAFDGCNSLTDVYYCGTQSDWDYITRSEIGPCIPSDATIHYESHTWMGTSCTAPRTCAICGEMESEAPGHDWVIADCTEPGICAVCGETGEEAPGHQWQEDRCDRCGQVHVDANGDTFITTEDAVYLLYHILLPEEYPLSCSGDIDGNGVVDNDDAMYLLYYVLLPDIYPLD